MNFFIIFTVFGCILISKSQIINQELNVALSLIKHLNVKNCIFATNTKDLKLFHDLKYLTFIQNIYITYKTFDQVKQYVMTFQYVKFKEGLTETLQPQKTVIVWRSNINEVTKAFSQIDHLKRTQQFDWIIIINEENVSNVDFLKIRYGHYESNFLIVYPIGETYQISEIYRIRKDDKLFIKTYGSWNSETGLNATNEYIFSRRFNLEGSYLVLRTKHFKKDTLHLHPRINNLYEFWTDMSRMMNFSSVTQSSDQDLLLNNTSPLYKISPDGFLDLKAWDTKEATIHYDFVPLWKYNIFLHIKYEADLPLGLRSLMRPFSSELWITLCLWLIISSISILTTDYLVHKCFSGNGSRHFSFTDSVFASLETLLNQGQQRLVSLANSALFISMLAEVLFILPSYTGAVVSFLTITQPYFPFTSINGFFIDGSYRMVSTKTDDLLHFITTVQQIPSSTSLLFERYLETSIEAESLQDQIEITCTGKKLAFLSLNNEHLLLLKAARHLRECKILQIPEVMSTTIAGMSTDYDSAFTSVFKHNWLRFQNYGIANKMKISFDLIANNKDFPEDDFQQIKFENISPILIVFISGILLALILFLGEVAYRKKLCLRKKTISPKPEDITMHQFPRRNSV